MLLGHPVMPTTLSLCLNMALCAWLPAALFDAAGSAGEASRTHAASLADRASLSAGFKLPPPGPKAPISPSVLVALAERTESRFERDYFADAAAVAVLIEADRIDLYADEGGPSDLDRLLAHRDAAVMFEADQVDALYVGTGLSAQSLAFHRILAHRNAAAMFEDLVRHAGQPGQLYGLSGLYLVDRARFQEVMRSYRPREAFVSISAGCHGYERPVEEMLAEIEAGDLQHLVVTAEDSAQLQNRVW